MSASSPLRPPRRGRRAVFVGRGGPADACCGERGRRLAQTYDDSCTLPKTEQVPALSYEISVPETTSVDDGW